ncbi:hypothetical protein K503DRAFT_770807 [Rhizopogon vinicolor AM-OR11-026]|uniref:Hydrophobin n=1 Tax=Rhizopogon vinicolor AM-OR11-026 TaxID=1314800 RepID=A0A1B7MZV5_9AGAM|nr:hypothetical protein K503DRAFT_770807 [Rhizopogon vinicolor AM-OR11-026]
MWPLRTSGLPSSSCDSGSKGLDKFAILEPVTKCVDNAFGGYYEESATSTACAIKSAASRQCCMNVPAYVLAMGNLLRAFG